METMSGSPEYIRLSDLREVLGQLYAAALGSPVEERTLQQVSQAVKEQAVDHLQNDWCNQKIDSPDPDMLWSCMYYKEATNADRLRAGTDEEIAARMRGCPDPLERCPNINCRECWLQWLRSPAEGGKR